MSSQMLHCVCVKERGEEKWADGGKEMKERRRQERDRERGREGEKGVEEEVKKSKERKTIGEMSERWREDV